MNSNEVTQDFQSEQSDIYRLRIVFIQRNSKTELIRKITICELYKKLHCEKCFFF